jgi:hypothetical protein
VVSFAPRVLYSLDVRRGGPQTGLDELKNADGKS